MERHIYFVQENDEGERLDKLVATIFTEYSRNQIKKMINDGLVLVNRQTEKSSYRVKWGDQILLMQKDPETIVIEPEDIPLEIIYEDADLVIINKPQGMVVHPTLDHTTGTLVNALLFKYGDQLSTISGTLRPGIVHRLDKDTSGLLIVAKNNESHQKLQEQFRMKTTLREYLAICHGEIKQNQGTIDAPIGRDPHNRLKRAVVDGGRSAVTHFKVLERFNNYTFIQCALETGRTHQIRVHMSYIGYPLVGDVFYGPKNVFTSHGQYLHAYKLGFIHPTTGKQMAFETPIPENFEVFLQQVRRQG